MGTGPRQSGAAVRGGRRVPPCTFLPTSAAKRRRSGGRDSGLGRREAGEGPATRAHPLCQARAFDPASGSAWVPGFLDDLAAELRRRAAALPAAPDRRELLAMLNRLLFGPRHPSDAAAGAGAGEGEERLPTIPPDGYGLGLAGNRDNYYDVRNSLLHKVLLRRRGIPISLAVIQCAVAQRCGLRLQAVGMPCHLLTKLGEAGSPDELFVDCFDGGRIMTREETFELMATIGLPCSPRFLAPMKQHEVHERMCANLVHIFRQLEDHRPLWQVLEVLQAFKPTPEYLLLHAQVALYRLGDTEAALSSTERVQALGSMDQQIVFPMIAQMQAEARRIREEHDRVCGMVSPPPEGLGCRVGDIVRHRRFGYRGVIAGWDVRCMASEDWKAQMNVGALSRGELQPFYRVLVDCRDRESQSTYVAQENIILAVEEALGAQPGEVTHDAEAWEVQNKELGAHFEGLSVDRDGEFWPHYVPNAFLAARHPCKAR
uniref:F-box protein 21 n=1 Tax=Tetraselmis sp. GSL018 TaxID=582737 RepID=A0A061R9L8_9CHLO|mmetsp:Transcript_18473/g.44145  ORF Transcript_18473/g.44145 Transcript_18473/m.44145 type:complete len:487 (+) Transcript_18473:777-2237(+)